MGDAADDLAVSSDLIDYAALLADAVGGGGGADDDRDDADDDDVRMACDGLRMAWINERCAPEILHFQGCIVDKLKARIDDLVGRRRAVAWHVCRVC